MAGFTLLALPVENNAISFVFHEWYSLKQSGCWAGLHFWHRYIDLPPQCLQRQTLMGLSQGYDFWYQASHYLQHYSGRVDERVAGVHVSSWFLWVRNHKKWISCKCKVLLRFNLETFRGKTNSRASNLMEK